MLQMFARTVRLTSLVTPSEARLLGIVIASIVALIFLSTLVDPPHWLQLVALFIHLISLVVGFGAVLAVDWYGLLSLSRRRVTIGDVLLTAERLTPLIWIGLAGLTASGVLLKPDLSSWFVVAKLCCVLGVGIVGVLALATSRLMERQMPTPRRSLIHRGMVLAGLSQSFWWTAVIIGFITNEGA